MEKYKLFVCVGLPRSGKSTLAQKWLNRELDIVNGRFVDAQSPEGAAPRAVVCADNIRLAMGCRYNYLTEGLVKAAEELMIRTLLINHDVLVDETNTSPGSMFRMMQIDPTAIFALVDTHPDVCKYRAIKSGQPDLLPVIDRLYMNLHRITCSRDIRDTIDDIRNQVLENKKFSDRIVVKNSPAVSLE